LAQKNRKAALESHERLMVVGSQARSMIRDTWGLTAAGSWHTVVATGGFCLLWSTMEKVSANDQGKPSPFGAVALAGTRRPIAPAAGAVTRCTQLIEPPRISQ